MIRPTSDRVAAMMAQFKAQQEQLDASTRPPPVWTRETRTIDIARSHGSTTDVLAVTIDQSAAWLDPPSQLAPVLSAKSSARIQGMLTGYRQSIAALDWQPAWLVGTASSGSRSGLDPPPLWRDVFEPAALPAALPTLRPAPTFAADGDLGPLAASRRPIVLSPHADTIVRSDSNHDVLGSVALLRQHLAGEEPVDYVASSSSDAGGPFRPSSVVAPRGLLVEPSSPAPSPLASAAPSSAAAPSTPLATFEAVAVRQAQVGPDCLPTLADSDVPANRLASAAARSKRKWPILSAPSPPSTAPSSSSASATASADPSLVTDSPRPAKKLKPAALKPPAGASARSKPAAISPASTTPALRKKGADVRWREFSLDHPQQEINGRTVNFPVGAGPIESAVLADLDDADIDLVLESLIEDDAKNGNFHILPAVGDKAGLEKLRSVAAMLPLTGLDRFIDPVTAVEDGSPARACAEASARAKAVVRRISGTPLTLGLANKTIDTLQLVTYELSAWAKSKEDAQRIVDDMRGCLAEAENAGKRRAMEHWLDGVDTFNAAGGWPDKGPCRLVGYVGWTAGRALFFEGEAAYKLRPFDHLYGNDSLIKLLLGMLKKYDDIIDIDLVFLGDGVRLAEQLQKPAPLSLYMQAKALMAVARSTAVSLGGANLAACGSISLTGSIEQALCNSSIPDDTPLEHLLNSDTLPLSIRLSLGRRLDLAKDLTLAAVRTIVQSNGPSEAEATACDELVEDDGFIEEAADTQSSGDTRRRIVKRLAITIGSGSRTLQQSSVSLPKPSTSSLTALKARRPPVKARYRDELLERRPQPIIDLVDAQATRPWHAAFLKMILRLRHIEMADIGPVLTRSSIRAGFQLPLLRPGYEHPTARRGLFNIILCHGSNAFHVQLKVTVVERLPAEGEVLHAVWNDANETFSATHVATGKPFKIATIWALAKAGGEDWIWTGAQLRAKIQQRMDSRARKDGGTVYPFVEPVLDGLLRL